MTGLRKELLLRELKGCQEIEENEVKLIFMVEQVISVIVDGGCQCIMQTHSAH